MRRNSNPHNKSKSRSLNRCASLGLINYLNQKYPTEINVSAITAAHKLFGKTKPLNKDDRFVKRFINQSGNIETPKLVEYFSRN